MAVKNRGVPELWDQQPGERALHYQRFCMYRNMPYGLDIIDQDGVKKKMPPQKRSLRRLTKILGLKSESGLDGISAKNNWAERVAAYDVYRMDLQRFSDEQAVKNMHAAHARLGVRLVNKASRGLMQLPASELSAQDIARLADIGVKIERLSRGESTDNTSVSGKVATEHSGQIEVNGTVPDMSELTDQELDTLERLLEKLHPQRSV